MPRLKSANFAVTELVSGISNSVTSFQVQNASAFPSEGPFMILVHDSTPGYSGVKEIMEVGSINKGTNTFSSMLRGRENTTAVAHDAGSRVECVWTAGTHGELEDKADKGKAGGYASLDSTGNVPESQLGNVPEPDADNIAYDDTESGLGVDNVQDAIDENASNFGAHLLNYATLKAIIGYTDNDIYGIEVDIPSNATTRLAGAVGKVAGADFDNINAFKRRRCIVADDRTVLAYHGDAGYTETGKTTVQIVKNETTYPVGTHVQVMVEQPKFYYKRVPLQIEPIANGVGSHLRKWRDYICDYPIYDFKAHPCFIRDGREYNYIYYPAYEGCIYDVSASKYLTADEQVADFDVDKLSSIAGVKPASGLTQSLTLPNTRKLANNRGEGWQQMDVLAHYAEAMLMSIEYATFDFQTAIGRGVVGKESGTGNASVNTGATANLGNSSGMATGTNGLVSVSYRGRENPWGNIWIWNDGLNIEAKSIHEAYWADSGFASDIKTSPYKNCGFTLAKSSGYISAIGYSQECDFMYIPSETLGAENRPLNDYFYQNYTHDGFLVARLGGRWNDGSDAGAFYLSVSHDSGNRNRTIGGGLLCLPKK